MITVENIRLDKGSNEDSPFYKWDVVSNGKIATFYTDQNGMNIWQEGVEPHKTHIYNATVIDHDTKKYRIDVCASVEDINTQLQGFADSGFFNKYMK